MSASEFTHLDPLGRARMVDVTAKDATHRRAVARCRVHMEADTAAKIASGAITKGDVLAVARVAGIQAAKQTPNLLPLCHPLLVGSVYVNFRIEDAHVEVEAQVDTVDRTGVEMEALTACADRRPHHLRHVQVDRPQHDHRRAGPLGEDRRAFRHLPPPRRRPRRPRACSPGAPEPGLDRARGPLTRVRNGRDSGRSGAGIRNGSRTAGYIRSSGDTTGAFALTIAVILVLGVLWVAVLVPPILRARGQQSRSDSVGDFTYKLSTLGRANGSHRKPSEPHVVVAADLRADRSPVPRR